MIKSTKFKNSEGNNNTLKNQTSELTKVIDSPLGPIEIQATTWGIKKLAFVKHKKSRSEGFGVIGNFAPSLDRVEASRHIEKCEMQLREYFSNKRQDFSVPLDINGTPFQIQTWKGLSDIPFGRTISYKKQAIDQGCEKSVRAVAAANGRNQIAIIIPCHRVISSSGHLHGYAGGLEIKRKLLELEGHQIKDSQVLS